MKLLELDDSGPIVVLTEFDVHDIFASARQVIFEQARCTEATRAAMEEWSGCYHAIKIEPEHPEWFTSGHVAKWERIMNELLQILGESDVAIHDDAEYTC